MVSSCNGCQFILKFFLALLLICIGRYVQKILNSAAWSIFLGATIMASTGILFIQSSVPSENLLEKNLARSLDIAFFCIFAIEMVLKLLSHGAWESNQSYFKQYANYLEFSLVMLQVY